MNKKLGIKNFTYSMLAQVITIALGVLIPRLVLVNLGSEANGLLTSAGNALSYLSLLEAGVGGATLNALYTPIGRGDRDGISRIMAATHRFYMRTGKIYLLCVLVIAAVFPFAVNSVLPRTTIFSVVLLSGMTGVISYFFQGKFALLLTAEGKNYVMTNISTVVSVCTSVGKIVLLLCGCNVIAIQLLHFALTLTQMTIILVYVKRHYPWIDLSVSPDFDAISQKSAVLVHQISGFVFSNTDVLVLTLFVGLKQVSIYSMYVMVFGMIKSIAVAASNSYVYALGQTYEDKPRFLRMYDVYETYSMAFTSALFCIGGILMTPFLKLYTAGVTDVNYIDPYLPWLFVAYYFLHNGRQSSGNVINFAQCFEATKWRSILESGINIVCSVALTWRWGIYGVILGTIAALLYRTNDMIIFAARLLHRSPWITYRRWIRNIALLLLCVGVSRSLHPDLSDYWQMAKYGCCLCAVILPLYFGVNSLCERNTARCAWSIVKSIVKRKS